MGLFGNLFCKKQSATQPETPPPAPSQVTSTDPRNNPDLIRVFDKYGREMFIPKEQWRSKVLPSTLQSNWNNAEQLNGIIVGSLNDGFFADVEEAAEHLYEIDPVPARGACLYAIVLMKNSRLDQAERVLRSCLERHGEDGSILTNLAKVYSARKDDKKAEDLLWHALEVDPNQDNGLLWFATIQRERRGAAGWREALEQARRIPGSWRPQLWLARGALEAKDLPAALNFYRQMLACAQPIRDDVLMQISGDLGKNGFIKEIVEVCAPHFNIQQHGLQVGNNLMKAYVEMHDAPNARRILEQLYAQQRPDWKEHLLFWEKEIDKLDKGYGPLADSPKLEVTMVTLEGPIWARDSTRFSELLPAKAADATKLAFLCGSADVPPTGHADKTVVQPTDIPGRVSRGLPMFLAEQVHLRTPARATVYVPWIKSGSFVLSGAPMRPESLGPVEPKPDYLLLLHLAAKTSPWLAQFSLIRMIDQKILGAWEQQFDPDRSAETVEKLTNDLFQQLQTCAELPRPSTSEWLFPPSLKWLPHYISGLEQALAVSCAELLPDGGRFLHAERSIIDHLLHLAIEEPLNICARLLMLSTLERESKRWPDIGKEFRQRIEQLQREHPLPQPVSGLTDAVVAWIYGEA